MHTQGNKQMLHTSSSILLHLFHHIRIQKNDTHWCYRALFDHMNYILTSVHFVIGVNTLRHEQIGRHFSGNIFKYIFLRKLICCYSQFQKEMSMDNVLPWYIQLMVKQKSITWTNDQGWWS